jgi:hypothetical protein
MKQALHIFAKDARHFWPEILVSLAITTAFAWIYPSNWRPVEDSQQLREILASAITVLVPISWAILLARVIHDESLVGDRQFWITRPYQWPQLLAAKALFLFVFLYLPILFAQCALLYQAGFAPFSYVHGLLYNLLLLTGILILPVVAIATITSNFAKMILTSLGLVLAIIALLIAGSSRTSVSLPSDGSWFFALFFSSILAVIILQYATRRTFRSRLLLEGGLLCMVGFGIASPEAMLVRRAYPRPVASDHPPVQLSFDPVRQAYVTRTARTPKDITLIIPLLVSGVAQGTAVKTDNIIATIEAPNGVHWTSRWQATYVENYLPSTQRSTAYFTVSKDIYEQVKSLPLTVRLTFALTQLQSGATTTVPLATGDFPIPGFGICSGSSFSFGSLQCRFPMHHPRLALVSSVLSQERCPVDRSSRPEGIPGQAWTGDLGNQPADFGVSPVWSSAIFFRKVGLTDPNDPNFFQSHRLCPGSLLSVTPYNVIRRTQTDLTITGLQVTDHSPSPQDSLSPLRAP